ncbi:MAG: Holliday junction resolvase RuvX [Paludibacter sp.]|nr:Holliday junction resolvase RuvX [Paludibacter sp.]
MGRILAIDYGQKRVGIAVTDILQISANGLDTVLSHEVLNFLAKYIEKEPVEKFVIGLPKQMNGEDSDSMKYIRPFVVGLQRKFPEIEVVYVDERFTSVLAHKAMLEGGLKKKDRQNKALVDKISATIILQSYLESNRQLPSF